LPNDLYRQGDNQKNCQRMECVSEIPSQTIIRRIFQQTGRKRELLSFLRL